MIVLCEMKNCSYYIFKSKEGKAYQDQCGSDEIEIGKNLIGIPECFSFEENREDDKS